MYNITKLNKAIYLINSRKENILICIPLLTEDQLSICLVLPRQTVSCSHPSWLLSGCNRTIDLCSFLYKLWRHFSLDRQFCSIPFHNTCLELKFFIRQLQNILLCLLLTNNSNKKLSRYGIQIWYTDSWCHYSIHTHLWLLFSVLHLKAACMEKCI